MQEAIEKFKNGEVPILIATDVASRGIDFPNVKFVFNFDMPTNIEDYVHRIGRTGRCGNKGEAISFINWNSKPIIVDLYNMMRKLNQKIPTWFQEMFAKVKDDKSHNSYPKHNFKKYNSTSSGFTNNNSNNGNNTHSGFGNFGSSSSNSGFGGSTNSFSTNKAFGQNRYSSNTNYSSNSNNKTVEFKRSSNFVPPETKFAYNTSNNNFSNK